MNKYDFERYAEEKPKYDKVADVYADFLYKWVGDSDRDLKVLDFGCGDGKSYYFFRKIFKEENIYGAEISKIRVDRCKNIGWGKIFLVEKLKPLPFDDGYFDLVNFDNVIEHISRKEIDFYLFELRRILRKNGKMIICTPNYPIKRVYDLLNSFLEPDLRRLRDDPTHVRRYNFGGLSRLLNRYFKVVKLEPTGGMLYNVFNRRIFSHKIIGVCVNK